MSGPVVAAIALGLGLIAFAFVIGTPIFGVPIAVLILGVLALLELGRRRQGARQMQGFRDEAKTEDVEFTARDKETLTTE